MRAATRASVGSECAEHADRPAAPAQQDRERLEPDRVKLGGPGRQDQRPRTERWRRRRAQAREPLPNDGGRCMFRRDVAPAALPLVAELAHPRHRHLDDRTLDADHLDGLIERSPDAVDIERLGRVGEPVEELAPSHVAAAGADELPRPCAPGDPGDLVTEGTQAVDLLGRVAAVLALGSGGRGKSYRRSHERIVGTGIPRSSDTWEIDSSILRPFASPCAQDTSSTELGHTANACIGSTCGSAYVRAPSYASARSYWRGMSDAEGSVAGWLRPGARSSCSREICACTTTRPSRSAARAREVVPFVVFRP